MSVVGILILTIFTRTLKGTNKSQILAAIKQNGQSVLEKMDKTIRNSDNVACISLDNKNIVVVKGGIYTRYTFIGSSSSANGFIRQDTPVKDTDPATGQEETSAVFINRVCTSNDSVVNPIGPLILTDTNPQTGVSIADGSFTRDSQAGFRDNIKITFSLDNGVRALPTLANEIDKVTFETTIQLR